MGLSDRDYMRSPDEPTTSGYSAGLIVLAVVASIFLIPRLFVPRISFSTTDILDRRLESQRIAVDPKHNRQKRLAEISPLDINVANFNDLLLLPRVNDKMALAIVAGRPFHTFEQLDDVPRIGPKTLELLRPHVIVDDKSIAENFPDAAPKLATETSPEDGE